MTVPFSWALQYAWPRKPILARNVVAMSEPLAVQSGLQTLVESVSNGIGSDAFAIVWGGRQLHGLDASGRSPASWTPEYFAEAFMGDGRAPRPGELFRLPEHGDAGEDRVHQR
jgi:gamma-glutamyltranspeptidase / glutathione hydrolase